MIKPAYQRILQEIRDGTFDEVATNQKDLLLCARRGWCHIGYDGNFQLSDAGLRHTTSVTGFDVYMSPAYATASRWALL